MRLQNIFDIIKIDKLLKDDSNKVAYSCFMYCLITSSPFDACLYKAYTSVYSEDINPYETVL